MDEQRRSAYRPMMPPERVERLRAWHEQALKGGRRDAPVTVEESGRTFVVPPDVYAPNPLGLAAIVLDEVGEGDRVLDMGTGSGVNGVLAAALSRQVLAVDVNPAAVTCARENAERNGVADRMQVRESDLFEHADGRFGVIIFDPPFRWFRPNNMFERGTADEDYQTLTTFFDEARDHLEPDGRILLSFGTTGDIDYLHHLITSRGFKATELRRVEGEKDGFPVAYFAYRLTMMPPPTDAETGASAPPDFVPHDT
jgi:release factor glutamine methyltransferase